jgi:hypothetical protein
MRDAGKTSVSTGCPKVFKGLICLGSRFSGTYGLSAGTGLHASHTLYCTYGGTCDIPPSPVMPNSPCFLQAFRFPELFSQPSQPTRRDTKQAPALSSQSTLFCMSAPLIHARPHTQLCVIRQLGRRIEALTYSRTRPMC